MVALIFLAGCSMSSGPAPTEKPSDFIADGAEVVKLPQTFQFTEGPTWTKKGTLVFSDIPASILWEWDGSKFSKRLTDSGNSNGTTLDKDGNVYLCHHGTRNVTKLTPDGKQTVLVDSFDGKKLNSPNDIALDAKGTVFFTDPSYGLPAGAPLDYGAKFVFMIKDGKAVKIMEGRDMPNGLVFSPDGSKLYVGDSAANKIDVLEVKDGVPQAPKLLCDAPNPDGLRMDPSGNIWAACSDGVRVIGPDGVLKATLKFPEQPANLCFGGDDGKTLYVTARTGVYSIKLKAAGIRPGF